MDEKSHNSGAVSKFLCVERGVEMATVHDIIFCLASTNADGQGASAHTILSAINPEYVPGLFSFSTIITLLGLDFKTENILKVSLASEAAEIGSIEGPVPEIDVSGNLPEQYKGVNFSINWNNVEFKDEGKYVLSVFLNGEKLAEKDIYVKGKNQ